ncbi:MAG: LPS-assembly protein LptD, partial [Nitrospirae bacterium]
TKPFKGGRAYLLGQYRRNLEGSSDVLTHVLPEIGYIRYTNSLNPKSFLSYNFEAKADNFWSDEGTKGQRLDIYPTFYINMGKTITFSQEIGLRETLYHMTRPGFLRKRVDGPPEKIIKNDLLPSDRLGFNIERQPEDFTRELVELTTTVSTKIAKRYSSFVHLIEPFVKFDYIPSSDEDDVPNFDLIDVRPKTETFTYELRNTFKGDKFTGWFRIQHGYTLLDNLESHSLPVTLETTLSSAPFYFDLHTLYNTHNRTIEETQTTAAYRWRRSSISVGRIYRRATNLDQYQFGFSSKGLFLDLPIDVDSRMWLDVNGNGVQKVEAGLTYHKQCWASRINYYYRENEFRVLFGIDLKGLGSLGLGNIKEAFGYHGEGGT